MSLNITLEWTPNPSTLKYVVDRSLLPRGAVNLTSAEAAKQKSPLGEKLFALKGVTGVMIGPQFVTITKGEEGDWDDLDEQVRDTLEGHLTPDAVVVFPEALAPQTVAGGAGVEDRIRAVLDQDIRPGVMLDGGDITLERFADGVAYLAMKGSCSGCPSSTMTLKMGVENRLREAIPEVEEVVSI